MRNKYFISVLFISFAFIQSAFPNVKFAGIFGDNMVLQRDAPVKIWGKADKGEQVILKFSGQQKKAKADKNGYWEVTLDEMKFGGPFELSAQGKSNTVTLKNILIGDVWICSGQSNMEFRVKSAFNAQKDIENADYPQIRSVNVPRTIEGKTLEDIDVKWEVCSPATVGNFTAVGYFYARELYKKLNIPIAIVNASWGATGVRTWTSRDAFDKLPDNTKADYDQLALNDFEKFTSINEQNKIKYLEAEKNDVGLKEKWYDPKTDISSLKELNVPGAWVSTELGRTLGNVWYFKQIELPEKVAGEPAKISLGIIDDGDVVWVNGVKVGEGYGYNVRRIYDIPKDVLRKGENRIAIKVNNSSSTGGFIAEPTDYYLQTEGQYQFRYSLSGKWKIRKSAASIDYGFAEIQPNIAPSLLYNTMINPFIKFRIKGAIWYQGEHDTVRGYMYRMLFPAMINDWRDKWGYEFPFYWVQLANMNAEDVVPRNSGWAELREAQTMTLSLPQTGQAVIYDIGNPLDVHPTNKQDVGARLALVAFNKTYSYKDIIYGGPTFKSYKVEGDKVIVSFDNVGSGLCTRNNKYEYLTGFMIAGKDQKFEWTKAYIQDDKVIVFSNKVKNPVAVRYAWSDNPVANLYNKEGLLAVPFRTDSWKGITEK